MLDAATNFELPWSRNATDFLHTQHLLVAVLLQALAAPALASLGDNPDA